MQKGCGEIGLPTLAIVTPGAYPIPANITGAVELSVMQKIPYLTRFYRVSVIWRQQKGIQSSLNDTILLKNSEYVRENLCFNHIPAAIKEYPEKVITWLSYNPDIIQVENRPRYVIENKKRNPDAKVCLSLHSVTFISKKKISIEELKESLNLADRIIVNSNFINQYIIQQIPSVGNKIVVNHLGANNKHYTPATDDEYKQFLRLHAECGLNTGPVILYSGRLNKLKGVHNLLRAMPLILRSFPSAKLVIVGSANYRKHKNSSYTKKLKDLAEGLGGNVIFKPHTHADDLVIWFQMSDIFVCPLTTAEAFGLVNVEAMSCGLPVVASETGGIPEVVAHNQTGLLVPMDKHV